MVRREREGGTRGMDESYARNVLKKGKRFKGDSSSRAGMDEEEEVDMGMYEDKKDRVTAQKRKEIDRAEAVRAHQQFNNAQTKCRLCFSSQGIAKHLVVALGSHTYVDGRGKRGKKRGEGGGEEGGERKGVQVYFYFPCSSRFAFNRVFTHLLLFESGTLHWRRRDVSRTATAASCRGSTPTRARRRGRRCGRRSICLRRVSSVLRSRVGRACCTCTQV